MAIQNDHIKTDPLASMPRGLVLFAGSERRLLSHPYSPPPQAVLEICLRGSGLLIHGPSLWAVPCSPHFYEVHGCGSFSAETAGNLHLELPRGLAHPGPVGGRASISQIHAPQRGGSAVSPSQQILVLGTVIDSARMRAVVTPERVLAIQQLAASFKLGVPHPLKAFQRMLGLIASASSVLQLGLLQIWPLRYWLKPRVPPHAWHQGCLRIRVSQACVAALAPWKNRQWMGRGVPLGMVCRRKVVSTDASNLGCGALCDGKLAFGPLVEEGSSAEQD